MTTNTVQLASVRLITDDLPRLVHFYETITGVEAQYLTPDFVEVVTPSATFALSTPERVAFITTNPPRAGANNTAFFEFLVDDVDALFARLQEELGDDLDIVQAPTTMPWGNRSVILRDPEGSPINLYTPVTPSGVQLQQNRTPKMREIRDGSRGPGRHVEPA
jgi:catechol 2,3-dioxygenase-like lactoylglutathione lyase family enzyme